MNESDAAPWNVLYIEDDEEDFILTREMLAVSRQRKISLTWAPGWEEGEQRLISTEMGATHYNAVLVDYDLHGASGIDLITRFAPTYPAPLILYTGRGSTEVDLEAMTAGATLYLTKMEANPLLLERAIRYSIQLKQREMELQAVAERDAFLLKLGDALRPLHDPQAIRKTASLLLGEQFKASQVVWAQLEDRFTPRPGNRDGGSSVLLEMPSETLGEAPRRWTAEELDLIRKAADRVGGAIERASTEAAVKMSEEKYRSLFNSIDEGFCLIEVLFDEHRRPIDYRFLEVNSLFEQQTGLHNCLGRCVSEILIDHDNDWFQIYGQVAQTGQAVRFEHPFQPIGRYYDVYAFKAGPPEEQQVAVLFKDISDHKKVEFILRESEQRFRAMADGTPVLIWVTEANGGIEFVNQAYADYFGKTQEEVKAGGWQPLVHPDDGSYVNEFIASIKDRRPFHAQCRVTNYNGEWRWIESHARPRFTDDGQFIGMAGSSLDITDRIQAQKEMERSNQALQEFAAIASHDLQEPLRKINAFGKQLEAGFADRLNEEGRDYLARITSASERMSKMLQGLLDYTRVTSQGQRFVPVDLNRVIAGALSDLEVRLKETGGVVETCDLPVIQGDPLQLHQLFQNLIGNALKYHRPGVAPVVRITCQPDGDKMIVLMVQDNGIGFNPAAAGKIFDPFVRLHGRSSYEGSGIGLAICKKIVDRHGGFISATAIPGQGAAFTLRLPC